MLRPATARCLLCTFRATQKAQSSLPQAQQRANLSLKYHASRSSSNPSLAEANKIRSTASAGRPTRRKQDGPFGGMNQRAANIRGMPEREAGYKPDRPLGRSSRSSSGRKDIHGTKALKMQRALAPVSYDLRDRIKQRIVDVTSFDEFGLLESIRTSIGSQALEGMTEITPTNVQRIAIPALQGQKQKGIKQKEGEGMQEFLLAAETGSGKTLAYLIPVLNAVKLAEQADLEVREFEKMRKARREQAGAVLDPEVDGPHPTTGRPRAIILVPTSELVEQVGALVKSFSHTVKFRSALISANYSGKVIRNRLFSPQGIDVLVSTPHLLSSIADSDPNILSRVTHLVIDEADTLMDRGFAPLTSSCIDRAAPSLKQLVLCSATIPRSFDNYIRKRFPNITRLVTPNLHAIPRRVQLGVVDIEATPYQGNKNLACADTIWSIGKAAADHDGPEKGMVDVKRVLVFVNERETTQELSDYLVSKGIDAIPLSRDTPAERLAEVMSSFTDPNPLSISKADHPGSLSDQLPNYVPLGASAPPVGKKLTNIKVIVTTDLSSRGIDTVAVRNVILYDVPNSTIDFIHRLGRTGRMGRRGRGIVLVGKNDRRDIVAEVKELMFRGQALI